MKVNQSDFSHLSQSSLVRVCAHGPDLRELIKAGTDHTRSDLCTCEKGLGFTQRLRSDAGSVCWWV